MLSRIYSIIFAYSLKKYDEQKEHITNSTSNFSRIAAYTSIVNDTQNVLHLFKDLRHRFLM